MADPPREGFFSKLDNLVERFSTASRRQADVADQARGLTARGAEAEALFRLGICLRCREKKATTSIDGKVVLCSDCAAHGAELLGELAGHAAQDAGLVREGSPLQRFLTGLVRGKGAQ